MAPTLTTQRPACWEVLTSNRVPRGSVSRLPQVQNEQHKRKPDVIVNGVKLHRMHLMVQGQRIPFFYCSQKRITSQFSPSNTIHAPSLSFTRVAQKGNTFRC